MKPRTRDQLMLLVLAFSVVVFGIAAWVMSR
jgi:hypothetical protein